jgi:hypothetical protein
MRPLLLGLLLIALPARAAEPDSCLQLRQERDALAQEALREELTLVRGLRERLCPGLSRRADAANAIDQVFDPIDYGALRECRQRTETELAATRPVLHRNLRQFPFYTATGAERARQADRLEQRMEERGCSAAR